MSRRRWLTIGAAGLALAVIAGGVALAKTSSQAERTKKSAHEYAKLFNEKLAAHLGVGTAALGAARKAAIEDVIAQALKDGALSPTQAAHLRERLQQGLDDGFPLGFLFGHHKFGNFKEHGGALVEVHRAAWDAVAAKLGMSTDALKTALRSGKTLESLAHDKGITMAALGAAAAGAAKPILDRLVKDGTISQERENSLLEKLRSGEFGRMGHKFFRRPAA
jgi:polyhydroxyalkanoate synthesis regulator phasin